MNHSARLLILAFLLVPVLAYTSPSKKNSKAAATVKDTPMLVTTVDSTVVAHSPRR
jgi:hypothetical protein